MWSVGSGRRNYWVDKSSGTGENASIETFAYMLLCYGSQISKFARIAGAWNTCKRAIHRVFFSRPADAGMVLLMHEAKQDAEVAAERRARLRALYARAFDEYGTRALWNMRRFEKPEPGDVLAMTRQLRIEGNIAARHLAEQIEMLIRAGH